MVPIKKHGNYLTLALIVANHNRTYGFPKRERLKSKKCIEQLFSEGKSVTSYPIKLIYLRKETEKEVPFQVAVMVPKKRFKSAVKRNRIKRLLREAYRLNKQLIFNNTKAQYALVILYLGKEMPDYVQVASKVQNVLSTFLKKISHEKTP